MVGERRQETVVASWVWGGYKKKVSGNGWSFPQEVKGLVDVSHVSLGESNDLHQFN